MKREPQNHPATPKERIVPPDDRNYKTAAARLSIASNALLVALKLIVGIWSGSVSILSEAVHSASDLLASSIAYFSVRVADAPPDTEHPYGHGKIEGLSSFAEALLIILAAACIIYESTLKLLNPDKTPPIGVEIGLALMAFSALLNTALSRHLRKVGLATDSQALKADAAHLQTDVLTSVGVFLGLALSRITGRYWFDPLTAILVALLIFFAAYRLIRDALDLLLDAKLPHEEEVLIQNLLQADPRILEFHKLRTRKSGSQRHADVHILIDDDCLFVEAHDISEDIEDRIRAVLPHTFVNIHIEPYRAEMKHQREAHGRNDE
jgi:cation diffusion facilitator family transporter